MAAYDSINVTLKVDITTDDAITPREIRYTFPTMFESRTIELWTYNVETVLAEKYETILRRGILTTRPRDFLLRCIYPYANPTARQSALTPGDSCYS